MIHRAANRNPTDKPKNGSPLGRFNCYSWPNTLWQTSNSQTAV